MAILLETFELLVLVPIAFLLLYLVTLSVLALSARKELKGSAARLRRFAVVVPAHNEETAIERTLHSLMDLDYPRDLFSVIVIADNCTDRTAEIAGGLGAEVLVREDPTQRGKGYALRWAFDRLLAPELRYDGVVVIDADTAASRDFLSVMNRFLERGAVSIQSCDIVKPQPDAWSSEVTRLGFALYNHVRPLGRSVIGCSAGVRGNGMCFAAETLKRYPWGAFSITEDLEYGLHLLLHGVVTAFAPEAKVYATMPRDADNARSQRGRWEGGRLPVLKKYAGPLLGMAVRRGSFKHFDAVVDLVTPPLVNLLAIVVAMTCVNIVLAAFGVSPAVPLMLFCLLLLVMGVGHMLTGLLAIKADRNLFRAVWYIPRYALWKLRLYRGMLAGGSEKEWVRTAREASASKSPVHLG